MNKPGILIAFEGTPGAGKTTIWNRLKADLALQSLSLHFVPVLIEPAEWSSESKYRNRDLIPLVDQWYLEQEKKRANMLRSVLASGRHAIQDRSFLSTLCFAFARSMWLQDVDYYRQFQRTFDQKYRHQVLIPDTVINLLVLPRISIQRVLTGATTRAAGPWTSPSFLEAWYEFVQEHARLYLPTNTNIISLEVSQLSQDEAYRQVYENLCRLLALP